MREAHKHLDLREEHFQAVASHLQLTLHELDVPEDLQQGVMTIVASTHDEVLNL
jgi:hemoglobin